MDIILLDGVPRDKVTVRLATAPGQELQSGKINSSESSAALAINTFGWFLERPGLLPHLPGAPSWDSVIRVDVEYCARFPWSGGRHPWLDAVVETDTHLIGIESKRFEPFRDKKEAKLSVAYDRPVWGQRMSSFERMRDSLRTNPRQFALLDAAQLVKHGFGLVTDARRKAKQPHLHYLYAEPTYRAGRPIGAELRAQHRREIATFSREIEGSEVSFSACSYMEWLSTWGDEIADHARRVVDAFAP